MGGVNIKISDKRYIGYVSVSIYLLYFILRIIFEVSQNELIAYGIDFMGVFCGMFIVIFTMYELINSNENKERKGAFKYVLLGALIIFISGVRLYR